MTGYRLFAVCCLGAMLGSGAAFGGDQRSLLYPPEIGVRPVVVAVGGPWQRRYWDPRYCEPAAWRRWRRWRGRLARR